MDLKAMTSLPTYLQTDYVKDKQQLDRIEDVILSVIPIFHERFMVLDGDGKTRTWPYLIKRGEELRKGFSYSTHSMILFVLTAIAHAVQPPSRKQDAPVLFPARIRTPLKPKQIKEIVGLAAVAMDHLLDRVTWKEKILVHSNTYGDNDPLTLSWLAELLLRPPAGSKPTLDIVPAVRRAAVDVCKRGQESISVLSYSRDEDARPTENPHSFLWLRLVHLAKVASRLGQPGEPGEWRQSALEIPYITLRTFEDELHRQLGTFTIPDSRFDPAVLVFALEGALQFDSQAVSDGTIESVFRILEETQKGNSYWRPLTPFLDNPKGMVLFPVSVEISNSLLRSYEILHEAKRNTHFARLETLLRRYVEWLLARAERLPNGEPGDRQPGEPAEVVGWHSEHVNKRGMVHMWETSQVLLFLVHYWSLLQRKIAKEGLDAAGLRLKEWDEIDEVKYYWHDEPLFELSGGLEVAPDNRSQMDYGILAKTYANFAKSGKPRSLLLYGPPGTGKTTVAEQMAFTLQRPLLVITVSDFLASGAAEVEARAKAVFQVLEEQEGIVILFDEIDQFLLDRNSRRYDEQEGIFQFMTPGMLTKFQNLRDAKRSIFIVATNYGERIDSAIKRQGRIDDRFLLSLPDRHRRRAFLWKFICGTLEELQEEVQKDAKLKAKYEAMINDRPGTAEVLAAALMKPDELWKDDKVRGQFEAAVGLDELLTQTVWFGFGDLKHLVKSAPKPEPGETWATIVEKLRSKAGDVQPSVKLGGYSSRFKSRENEDERHEQTPSEEFAILLYLVGECGATLRPEDRQATEDVFAKKPKAEVLEAVPASVRETVAAKIELALRRAEGPSGSAR
jgi:adenylate kinase family enzyme